MTYNKKTLARIGREVINNHPTIATGIISQFKQAQCDDLTRIPMFFTCYCNTIGVKPETIQGPVYKSQITEMKKVFVSAMIVMYVDKYLLNQYISNALGQPPSTTTWMINEVKVRYKKDIDFTEKVNNILNLISDDKRTIGITG